MAGTSNTALRIAELDFNSIKTNLKNFLRSQSEFQDYDFEGSGMSVLLDVLAYNTHYMGYYLNMVGNEMFLDTAQLRSSILSHAKSINYIPSSRKGAKSLVNLLVTPSGTESNVSTLTLAKYTKFLGADIDGINYNFVTTTSNTATKVGSTFSFANVAIQQGDVISQQYMMDPQNTKRTFNIPSANVDTDTIEVRVQQSTSNTDVVIYTKSETIVDLTANSTVYFVEEAEDLNYKVYFGDGVIGKVPQYGNIITITYLDTAGSAANKISKFTAKDRIGNLFRDNVSATIVTTSVGGTEKETVEQARFRAPYAYTAQNRAVTTGDYEAQLLKKFSYIDSVSVWGGEDNIPVSYGKVYFSIKTKQNFALSNLEKEYIKNTLIKESNVVTVTPEIVDPDFLYIRIIATVRYDPNTTTRTADEIGQLVRAAIYDYNDNELSTFKSLFRKSKLQSYIEASDKSILGSEIAVYLQKRIVVDTESSRKYEAYYNTPIQKGNYKNRLFSYPEMLIADDNGFTRNALFEEVFDNTTGINSGKVITPGKGYSRATVTINGDGTGATAIASLSNGGIAGITMINKGIGYTTASITIDGDGTGASVEPKLEINYGTIRTFYYEAAGEKVVINPNAGSIDYDNGIINLNLLKTSGPTNTTYYNADELTIFVPAGSELIYPKRNGILNIDEYDPRSVQVTVLAET